jgi:hypothetical protein
VGGLGVEEGFAGAFSLLMGLGGFGPDNLVAMGFGDEGFSVSVERGEKGG